MERTSTHLTFLTGSTPVPRVFLAFTTSAYATALVVTLEAVMSHAAVGLEWTLAVLAGVVWMTLAFAALARAAFRP